jgi:hypothetical protein
MQRLRHRAQGTIFNQFTARAANLQQPLQLKRLLSGNDPRHQSVILVGRHERETGPVKYKSSSAQADISQISITGLSPTRQ